MPSTRSRSSDPLLVAVQARREIEARDAVATLTAVLDWAVLNTADDTEAEQLLDPFEEPALHLGGAGCPVIAEYAALDLALSLGMSTDAGLAYLGKALELRHRLPRLYARVVALEVAVWKAFKVADLTTSLPPKGADHVDRVIAPFLHTCSWAQVDRAVEAARAQHDPAEAERRRQQAAEGRHASVYLDDPTSAITGTVDVRATLDLADAIDLETALRDGAQTLADLGSTESLDVRRSQALGEMARQQQALDLDTGEMTSGAGRGVTLFVHLDADDPDTPAVLDNTLTPVLLEQVRQWCETAGTEVTVKPVVDLAANPCTDAYQPTDAIRELVRLRDGTCVFPTAAAGTATSTTSCPSARAGSPRPTTSPCSADVITARRPTAAGPTSCPSPGSTRGPAPPAPPTWSNDDHPTADDPDRPETPPPTRTAGTSARLSGSPSADRATSSGPGGLEVLWEPDRR